jgi:DNA mismatch repair ATPase MutS
MKAFLMYSDADFDPARPAPWNEVALTQDLGLDPLCRAMAQGDEFLLKVARAAVLASATDPDTILYRQAVLRDCLSQRNIVLAMYRIAVDAIERERKEYFGIFGHTPGSILSRAITVMTILSEHLTALRKLVDAHGDKFEAAGFRKLFATLRTELDAAFFEEVEAHLKRLRLRDGVLVSAQLGKGLKGENFVLRRTNVGRWDRVRRLFKRPEERACTVYIHPRDQAGGRILGELRDRGVNLVANALAQSVDLVLSFFWMLRTELAFYIGCANLHDELERRGQPTCFPVPVPLGERAFSYQGLYDASLALAGERKVVGNDVNADHRLLVIITGANQGGKSTFLRSVGLAQLMMQCGMFVPAEAFCASVCDGLFTHFKREEDATMTSGKLDEELKRMSEIVDHLTPHALLLFNESFAATNEREGAEIARQITRALVDKRKMVFIVTHSYEFANWAYRSGMKTALFLRADRNAAGERTFKLLEAEPLQTSFGGDLYARIFEAEKSGDAPAGEAARASFGSAA